MDMKKMILILLCVALLIGLSVFLNREPAPAFFNLEEDAVKISLSPTEITANGLPVGTDASQSMYLTYADFDDKHHTLHICAPGQYVLSGNFTGQIAVDLGASAVEDKNAVVSLALNGVEITSQNGAAILFNNVYECGGSAGSVISLKPVTENAGANIALLDGTENSIIAPVAIHTQMSMNLFGGKAGSGVLSLQAEDSAISGAQHFTQYGGILQVQAGVQGVSMENASGICAFLGGSAEIQGALADNTASAVSSGGFVLIDGGDLSACAEESAGITAGSGISLQSGGLISSGGEFSYFNANPSSVLFSFDAQQSGGDTYRLQNEILPDSDITCAPERPFRYLLIADDQIKPGTFSLWRNDVQLKCIPKTSQSGNTPPATGIVENQDSADFFSVTAGPHYVQIPEIE